MKKIGCFVFLLLIFAVIVIHNLSQAKQIQKIAFVQSDLRTLKEALESYYVDHNIYPPIEKDYSLPKALTTPVQYVKNDFQYNYGKDRFGLGSLPLRYFFIENRDLWILQNCGRDEEFDFTIDHINRIKDAHEDDDCSWLDDCKYDPTNGTISGGDLLRTNKYFFWWLIEKDEK